jgi:hypothetical protein
MLTNLDQPAAKARLEEEVAKNPPFAAVIESIATSGDRFAIDPATSGLEIVPLNEVKGAPNRCRLKLFRPREERERLCAFFYKRSNLSFSHDRYAYGAVEFMPGAPAPDEVRGWLEWLVSGLDPGKRPAKLRRAFPYTVPE